MYIPTFSGNDAVWYSTGKYYPPKVTPLNRHPTGSVQSRSLPEVRGSDSQQEGHCRHPLLKVLSNLTNT
jgi:hypothetical protein